MIRNFIKNLFSTTATRGRLEYLGALVALIASATLLATLGLSATTPFVAYLALFTAFILQIGVWFVVAQRVRDIGWNVPLVIGALLVTNILSTFTFVGEGEAVTVVGGPFAWVNIAILFAIALVPGKSREITASENATA